LKKSTRGDTSGEAKLVPPPPLPPPLLLFDH
jgi:hypothetical protein